MTDGVQPLTMDERKGRIEKARRLMWENRLDAIYIRLGSTMFYFTGTRWRGADSGGLVGPAEGELAWIVRDTVSEPRA